MSTKYTCYTDGHNEISIVEHSGNLDLYADDDYCVALICDLTPEQLATIAIKMLKAAYYQDEDAVQLAVEQSRIEYEVGVRL